MKLSVIQFCPEFGNKEQNIEKMQKYISSTESDIIVFPELCISGYSFSTKEKLNTVAEPFNGETVSLFQEKAINYNKIIIFGFPEKENDNYYNSAAILFPNKKLSRCYRKTHLFYKEHFIFTPGDTGFFVINDFDIDIKIGTMICYDWRFPEAARTLGLQGADLIVCPSNLITEVWSIAMPARALENKVYLAVANRTGYEENSGEKITFTGESAVWNYNGKIMKKAERDNEIELSVEIEPKKTRDKSFNPFNNIFSDRKPEFYFK